MSSQSPQQPIQQQAAQQGNALGVAALVLGIIAIAIAFIPIINAGSFVLGGLAVILGIIGMLKKNSKRGTAITGLILGAVAIIIAIAVIATATAALNAISSELSKDGEYAVTIDTAVFVKDYDDAPAVVVDFTFKNDSEKDANFLTSVTCKAFQNGAELESAIIADNNVYDSGLSMLDMKPGVEGKVQSAWVLSDTSLLSVECKTLFSLSDKLLASKEFEVK
ncbi:MAG: DUF5067 domain-containing protein [Propionibacteriaceae bacterium]|nr:DUF5067 domain-containing protein [Propionibacteriaceae bacterium]